MGETLPPPSIPETTVPLRIELKPFERIVIGDAVLINSGTRTSFMIDGDAPILREKHTVTPENANTPAKRLYLCVRAPSWCRSTASSADPRRSARA